MTFRWDSSVARKMVLSGILLALILIRHAVGSYEDDYGPRRPVGIKQQHHQAIHQYSRIAQHVPSFPHPHRHHHDQIHKNTREMHLNSQYLQLYHDRDYRAGRPTTKATTTTPTTTRTVLRAPSPAWKWSSTTAANLRLAQLTHIAHQGGNETSAGSTAFRNRLSDGERQQWSANNKQIFIEPFRVQNNNNAFASTTTIKTTSNHMDKFSWSHYSRAVQQQEEHHLGVEDNHRTLLGKTSRISDVDSAKISHKDQSINSIADNKDDYDYDYYEDDDESEEAAAANKIEETKSRQDMVDDFNPEYLDDEPNPQTESLNEEKWHNYGTAEDVERSRRQYFAQGRAATNAHKRRIEEEGRCRWPHPKVVPVKDASKHYIPHCTILHKCGDDTGCCETDTKTCVAKRTTTVQLHFYVTSLDGSTRIEVLSFVNHTECHCVDRCVHSSCAERRRDNETCRCPSHFDVFEEKLAMVQCRCDCLNSNRACHELKRGEDSFPAEDQKCISDNMCQTPTCQYGSYNTNSGRCPTVKLKKRHTYS